MRTFFLVVALCFYGSICFGQQFSYKPKNPFFGGDTFNYQQLLSSAAAQNGLTAPTTAQEQESDLDRFGRDLSGQLLNRIERELSAAQLDGLNITEEGTFTFGNLNVEVFETFEGLVINILDTTNGEETQVIVPN
ncbi:curli assembly protein CsgF [Dokdonia sp. Dokd-P16]|uniref:curli assembly protein CsgF n=1 Tax=Dokdonia sp. Dokd-P16 TaxID=2173169 RepID=UPI000D543945|nr:curli assembly protein CsgF [Dokdonia sp. Dokd-P16]AWH74762.1 curli assembly protein CsgF [Dokdonia sp. Dokd-P16]